MLIAVYSHSLPEEKDHWKETDWFVYEVLKRLVSDHKTHDFLWITPFPTPVQDITQKNIAVFPLGKKPAGTISSHLRLHRKLPAVLKKRAASVLINMGGALPALSLPRCTLLETPLPGENKLRPLLQHTDSIAVISNEDQAKLRGRSLVSPNKIVAVRRGIYAGYKPLEWEEREEIKRIYTEEKEYFIYPGPVSEDNNILNLLKAFSVLKKRLSSNMVLVLAGDLDKNYKAFPELLQTYYFRNDVKWLREITLAERVRLIGAAYGLICPFPSLTIQPEILQAFACRVPAIVADGPLNRETAEDAAIYFRPQDIENTGDVLCEIYKDEALRSRLIALGDIQAAKYSWNKTAGLMWSAVNAALGDK